MKPLNKFATMVYFVLSCATSAWAQEDVQLAPQIYSQSVYSRVSDDVATDMSAGFRVGYNYFFKPIIASEIGYTSVRSVDGNSSLSGYDLKGKLFLTEGTRLSKRLETYYSIASPKRALYITGGYAFKTLTFADTILSLQLGGPSVSTGMLWSYNWLELRGLVTFFLNAEISYEKLSSNADRGSYSNTSAQFGAGIYL